MNLAEPKITTTPFDDLLSLSPIVSFATKAAHVNVVNEFMEMLRFVYDEKRSVDRTTTIQENSKTSAVKNRKMLDKKIVPKRFADRVTAKFNVEKKTVKTVITLSDIVDSVLCRSHNELWNLLYRSDLKSESVKVTKPIITIEYECLESSTSLISLKDENVKVKCFWSKDRQDNDVVKFCYPKAWIDYRVRQQMGTRSDGTTSITQIVNKIDTWIDLSTEKAKEDAEKQENKDMCLDIIEKALGTRQIDFGYYDPHPARCNAWSVIGNPAVKYIIKDGVVKLSWIDESILSKLDPVLAMTLFR